MYIVQETAKTTCTVVCHVNIYNVLVKAVTVILGVKWTDIMWVTVNALTVGATDIRKAKMSYRTTHLVRKENIKMREILFRGKREGNGEWMYGCLFVDSMGFFAEISNDNERVSVHTSTVGQYTGVKDKNGNKIFEGDILLYDAYCTMHEVVFERRNGHSYFGWIMNGIETWHFDSNSLRILKVIGNIHDNPELLKGRD